MIFQIINLNTEKNEKPHLEAFQLEDKFTGELFWAIEVKNLDDLIELSANFQSFGISVHSSIVDTDLNIIPVLVFKGLINENKLN